MKEPANRSRLQVKLESGFKGGTRSEVKAKSAKFLLRLPGGAA